MFGVSLALAPMTATVGAETERPRGSYGSSTGECCQPSSEEKLKYMVHIVVIQKFGSTYYLL